MFKVLGSVHGQFQPPHNEHREYILATFDRCEFVWVGITQFNVQMVDAGVDPHRASELANPLTYFERSVAISRMLEEAGVSRERYVTTPFPIEKPEELSNFLSCDVKCFTTVLNKWNRWKIDRLVEQGYEVEVLWDRSGQDVLQGKDVRRLIEAGDPSYRDLVPTAVWHYLEELDLASRLRAMRKASGAG